MSIMGELTASIAHEVNQPLSGVVSNGSACLRWLAGDTPNIEEDAKLLAVSSAMGSEPLKSSAAFGPSPRGLRPPEKGST